MTYLQNRILQIMSPGHVTGAVPRGTGENTLKVNINHFATIWTGRPPLPSPTRVQEADQGRGREGRGPGAALRVTSWGLSFVGQQNDIAQKNIITFESFNTLLWFCQLHLAMLFYRLEFFDVIGGYWCSRKIRVLLFYRRSRSQPCRSSWRPWQGRLSPWRWSLLIPSRTSRPRSR